MGEREKMIRQMRESYGLDAPSVFSAMLQVPREKFVDKKYKNIAYMDRPVSIGHGQTMSQPYTVAFMTHLLVVGNKDPSKASQRGKQDTRYRKLTKVLEIGTGSGYQAAVLSHLAKEVYTIEIVPELAKKARERFKRLGYKKVHVRQGSGQWGWAEYAPFDAILVTAGLEKEVPRALLEQLKVGGILVAPIGKGADKQMTRFKKLKNSKKPKFQKKEFGIFHFVPFVEEKN